MSFKRWLVKNGACPEAVAWVGDRDLETAWAECERPDWMVWLCRRMYNRAGWPSHKDVLLALCACVNRAMSLIPGDGSHIPRTALALVTAYARGEITANEAYLARNAMDRVADKAWWDADQESQDDTAWGRARVLLAAARCVESVKLKDAFYANIVVGATDGAAIAGLGEGKAAEMMCSILRENLRPGKLPRRRKCAK